MTAVEGKAKPPETPAAAEPQWGDADMAEAYLAGYVMAVQREHPNAAIAIDLVDIADDFGNWVTDYEMEQEGL